MVQSRQTNCLDHQDLELGEPQEGAAANIKPARGPVQRSKGTEQHPLLRQDPDASDTIENNTVIMDESHYLPIFRFRVEREYLVSVGAAVILIMLLLRFATQKSPLQWYVGLLISLAPQLALPGPLIGKEKLSSIHLVMLVFCALLRGQTLVAGLFSFAGTLITYVCHSTFASHRTHFPLLVLAALLAPLNGSSSESVQEITNSHTVPSADLTAFLMLMPMLTEECNIRMLWMMFGAFIIWAMSMPSVFLTIETSTIYLLVPVWIVYAWSWGVTSLRFDKSLDEEYREHEILAKSSDVNGGRGRDNQLQSRLIAFVHSVSVLILSAGFLLGVNYLKSSVWTFDTSVAFLLAAEVWFTFFWSRSGYEITREACFVLQVAVLLLSSILEEHLAFEGPGQFFPVQAGFIVSFMNILLTILLWSSTLSAQINFDDFRTFHLFLACYGHATREVINTDFVQTLGMALCIVDRCSKGGLFHGNRWHIFAAHLVITILHLFSGIALARRLWMFLLLIPIFPLASPAIPNPMANLFGWALMSCRRRHQHSTPSNDQPHHLDVNYDSPRIAEVWPKAQLV